MRASETLAFLFTDIEGSTRLWEQDAGAMEKALRRHDAIMREAASSHEGTVFKTIGDAFCMAFPTAPQAVHAALASQHALHSEEWPENIVIKSRMAVHVGAVDARDGDYFGPPLNRISRLLNAAHGGQILLTQAAFELVRDDLLPGVEIKPLGEHRLKDLTRPEPVYMMIQPGLPDQFPPIRSLTVQPNNLPLQLTTFVGREKETQDLLAAVRQSRLVTLTGAGGTGKTRLALQVAAELVHHFDDGVWLVELASVVDPAHVPAAVAEAIGVSESSGTPLLQTITDHLLSQTRLLILDNCEHLVDAASRFVDQILRHCPKISLLVTSRESLRISGEQTFRVPPLSLPDPYSPQTVESVNQFEAVKLFIDRALLLNPSFLITNETAPALALLCHKLDGIPLAIELAAARTRTLTVPDIARRLDQRFQMLTGGARTAMPRQQTLRALVDWSYELLSSPEKALLERLGVFAGGFSIGAVEATCAGGVVEEWEILDLLTSLVDKSLVFPCDGGDGARFTMQETIRQYARERLVQSGEEGHWHDRHLRTLAELFRAGRPALDTADQARQLEIFNRELENARAAIRWGLNPACQVKEALGVLIARIGRFWYIRGMFTEAEQTTRECLAALEEAVYPSDRATIENTLGLLAYHRAEYPGARQHYERAAEIARDIGDREREAVSWNNVANVLFMERDFAGAIELYGRGLSIFRELNDEAGIGLCLNNQACCFIRLNDLDRAEEFGRAGYEARLRVGEPWNLAYSHVTLGDVAWERGEMTKAREHFSASLALREQIGDRVGVAGSQTALGWIELSEGKYEEAGELWRRALQSFQEQLDTTLQLSALLGLARCVAESNPVQSVRILGAVQKLSETAQYTFPPAEERARREILANVKDAAPLLAEGELWSSERAVKEALI